MCSPKSRRHRPPNQSWANMRKPMPLGVKIRLTSVNLVRRITRLQTCCGNHGQPGC